MCRYSEAVEPGTVWTWNAIGKAPGRLGRSRPTPTSRSAGFLLNHLITDELPGATAHVSNSDPVTGQAGWYDVRVRIYPAAADEPQETWPRVRGGAGRRRARERARREWLALRRGQGGSAQ